MAEIKELINTVELIQKKILKYEVILSDNESMTRYVLIDPLLRALGWDLSDPDIVRTEDTVHGTRSDYVLMDVMVIEAKKLHESLDDQEPKLRKYMKNQDVRYGALTDGCVWQIYDAKKSVNTTPVRFRLTDNIWDVINNGLTDIREEALNKKMPPTPESYHSLRSFLPKSGTKPKSLFYRGKKIPLGSWAEFLKVVAQQLIDENLLNESDCPIYGSKSIAILNTRPCHPTGKKFQTTKNVGKFYVNTNMNARTSVKWAIRLSEYAGVDPNTFAVA